MIHAIVVEEGDQQCFDLEFFAYDSFMVEVKSVNTMSSIAFWFRIELVEPGLISRDDVFQKQ